MNLKQIIIDNIGDVLDELSNDSLVSNAEVWSQWSYINLNSSIAVGWLKNDNILIINNDGIFIYDILKKEIILRDYESNFHENISKDNLFYS
jgi:hypothetical protein